ncbi:MAG: DPP IV N-terminal domain-containing protein [Glaciecola sp.]
MKNNLFMIVSSLFITLSFTSHCVSADDTQPLAPIAPLDIERIFSAPALQGTAPSMVKLSPDGKRVTFIRAKATDNSRFDLWEYNIKDKQLRLLFDADDLHQGDENLSDEEKARRERMRVSGSGILSYSWSADGKALLFPLAGDVFYYLIGAKKAQQLLNTPEFETDIKLSPKGNYISFIRNQNIFIKHIATGKEQALTTQGGGTIKYGMAEFVAQEEMGQLTGYWWAPDESHIAFTRVDETPVDVITRSEIYAERITTIEQKYPKAGTPNVLLELYVQNIQTQQRQAINLGTEQDIYLPRVQWSNTSALLTYQVQSRNQQTLQLFGYDVATQLSTTLLTEHSNTWLNLHDDLHFLRQQDAFIWASERDGFKHLYLYRTNGELLRQLTSGDWVVTSIAAIDENTGSIYINGRKDTPLESHVYAVDMQTSSVQRITELGKHHDVKFAKDASIYVDVFSDINTPAQTGLYFANGQFITWLDENKVSANHPLAPYASEWIAPEFGTIAAPDNTQLHYRLYKPANISGKHPVIVYHYGGPRAQVVTNKWGGNRGLMFQYWAQQGYVVFSIDNRGSYYRGKAFEDPIYKAMGSIEIEDQKLGVDYLRTLDFVDPAKIGVYGHSYGGYMSLMAMFKAPDYFAVGVSGAPVTEWRLYDTHYTERYMGNPNTDKAAYDAASVFPYANNLQGELLIYHGMADDNVLFTHATKLYKHLQDNAKLFHVMDYPGKKHSIRGKNTQIHMFKKITHHFDTYLK